jgi:hypothetical protein
MLLASPAQRAIAHRADFELLPWRWPFRGPYFLTS